jgi:hypothetical protein
VEVAMVMATAAAIFLPDATAQGRTDPDTNHREEEPRHKSLHDSSPSTACFEETTSEHAKSSRALSMRLQCHCSEKPL